MSILLTILLTILKVILIVVLAVLLLVLLILLLVLFCPFTYRLTGNPKRDIKATDGNGEVRWLFGAIGGGAIYLEKKITVFLRIFGFRKTLMEKSFGSDEKDDAAASDDKSGSSFGDDFGNDFEDDFEDDFTGESKDDSPYEPAGKSPSEVSPLQDSGTVPPAPKEQTETGKITAAHENPDVTDGQAEADKQAEADDEQAGSDDQARSDASAGSDRQAVTDGQAEADRQARVDEEPETIPPPYVIPEEPSEEAPASASPEQKLLSISSRILEAVNGVLGKLTGLPPKIQAAVDKVHGLIDKLLGYKAKAEDILKDPVYQGAFRHILREIKYILKTLIPKKLRLDLKYSAGAPDVTGKALAVLSAFPYAYHAGWNMEPDFDADKPYAEGTARLDGAIYLYKYVGVLLRLLLDSNCRKLLKTILKLKNNK